MVTGDTMDGVTVIAIVGITVGPLYPIVIHNAVQSRLNKKLLERLNSNYNDKQDGKEGKNGDG